MSHVTTITRAAESLRQSDRALASAAAAGRVAAAALESAAAFRTIAAWTLSPAPRDPRTHVRAAHAEARPYLTRLLDHPADREMGSVMTADLFRRLTRRPGDDAGAPPRRIPPATPTRLARFCGACSTTRSIT